MNVFMAVPDYQKLYSSHMFAWMNGLKTAIYYLRTRPSEDATQITIDPNIKKLNESSKNKKQEANEVCDACSS